MDSSISPNIISFIRIGNRPSTSTCFSGSNQIQNEVSTFGTVLVRVSPPKNLPRTGLPITLCRRPSRFLTNCNSGSNSGDVKKGGESNSNYVVPLDKSVPFSNSPYETRRPLAEILRDLNKKIPDNIVKAHVHGDPPAVTPLIPWYHANRLLNFYAQGWCGQIGRVIFSDDGSVTVVYGVTVYGSDEMASRESTGTVYPSHDHIGDPVAAAEELAFSNACAQLGFGLYLYHRD